MHRSPIVIGSSLADVLSRFSNEAGKIVILPASLGKDDPLARQTADLVRGDVIIPATWSARLRSLGFGDAPGWQTVDIRAIDPSCELDRVVLPDTLVEANAAIVACDLDRVAVTGPYVLDVAASYVAPTTRLRLHASRERVATAAEIALAFWLRGAVLALTIDGNRRYVVTPDPIAGELAALALSERARNTERSVVGPWEDPIVQRATELQLGALLPSALELVPADDPFSTAIARQLARRLGIA
ncbi:MAG: hypothetical protein QM589_08845 [Thermomicrobiales bacterium]